MNSDSDHDSEFRRFSESEEKCDVLETKGKFDIDAEDEEPELGVVDLNENQPNTAQPTEIENIQPIDVKKFAIDVPPYRKHGLTHMNFHQIIALSLNFFVAIGFFVVNFRAFPNWAVAMNSAHFATNFWYIIGVFVFPALFLVALILWFHLTFSDPGLQFVVTQFLF